MKRRNSLSRKEDDQLHKRKKKHTQRDEVQPWDVEKRAGEVYDVCQSRATDYIMSLPFNEQGQREVCAEELERIWLDVIGGLNKGRPYVMGSERYFSRAEFGRRGNITSAGGKALNRTIEALQQETTRLTQSLKEVKSARAKARRDETRAENRQILLQKETEALESQVATATRLSSRRGIRTSGGGEVLNREALEDLQLRITRNAQSWKEVKSAKAKARRDAKRAEKRFDRIAEEIKALESQVVTLSCHVKLPMPLHAPANGRELVWEDDEESEEDEGEE